MKRLCDKCKYQLEKGKCNSFDVLAMTTPLSSPRLPEYREMTEKEQEYITKLNFCMGYEEETNEI